MLKQKIEWYTKKQVEVKERVNVEKNEIPLDRLDAQKDLFKTEAQK